MDFKKRNKQKLNQLKFKLNLNSGFKNDLINSNKNKFFLSPTNRKLKKSESSSTLIKGAANLSTNKINNNINNYNFLSPHLKRNFSNFSNKDIRENNLRNLNSAKRKKYKENIEGY